MSPRAQDDRGFTYHGNPRDENAAPCPLLAACVDDSRFLLFPGCGLWKVGLNPDSFCRDGSQEVLFIDHKVRSQ